MQPDEYLTDCVGQINAFFKNKTELRKEWVKLAIWGAEKGFAGIGKGLGQEGEKIVREWREQQ